MTDNDRKLQKMLGEFKEKEQYPSFQNLWSLATNKRRRPAAEGAWRWILGPAVGLSLLAFITLVITTEPNGEGTWSPFDGEPITSLADIDTVEVPHSPLDSFWNEEESASITLAAGDSFFTGEMDFLLLTEIPAWE